MVKTIKNKYWAKKMLYVFKKLGNAKPKYLSKKLNKNITANDKSLFRKCDNNYCRINERQMMSETSKFNKLVVKKCKFDNSTKIIKSANKYLKCRERTYKKHKVYKVVSNNLECIKQNCLQKAKNVNYAYYE